MLEKIKDVINKNKKIGLMSLAIIIIFVFICIVINNKYKNKEPEKTISKDVVSMTESKDEIEYYTVDIKGEINNPGVYLVASGSTINEVISISGGVTKNANTRYINLAKKVKDEMTIIVYSNKEVEELLEEEIVYETPCVCEEIINESCIVEYDSYFNSYYSNNLKNESNLININTASSEELQTLSGIGEAKALAIINYRKENGDFINIEDIMNVSGISESTYSKIKNFITTK